MAKVGKYYLTGGCVHIDVVPVLQVGDTGIPGVRVGLMINVRRDYE